MKTNKEISIRKIALKWWNSLSFETKFFKTIKWLSSEKRDTTERHPNDLTGREIEQIYFQNIDK